MVICCFGFLFLGLFLFDEFCDIRYLIDELCVIFVNNRFEGFVLWFIWLIRECVIKGMDWDSES